ncbi:MAG: HAMP domain-containing histidine kinase [Clostridia bacterium]|nr:HAMP domain-containing histidine kinase [Clostridia bacterium]
MKILRNRAFRCELIIYVAGTALCAAAAFFPGIDKRLLIPVTGLFFIIAHFAFTGARYRAIAKLVQGIDRVLHGNEELIISENSEGEISLLQSEIQKMTVRLRESSDMLLRDKRFLSDSIADISHQLRTPLTSLNIVVSTMSDGDVSESHRTELLREMKKQLKRIDWLVETLLKMSRIDSGTTIFKNDRVLIRELVSKSVEPLIIPMELRNISLTVKTDSESFSGDLQWTAEAVQNIIKNCTEHTPDGGKIEIEASETALFTQIMITDSGEGFDSEDIPHLFERFYRGKNSGKQSIGIGLALSRMIIVGQNGTVKAENAQSGGAKFTIRFYKSVI